MTVAYTQTDPPGGSIGPGEESAIYDCLVVNSGVFNGRLLVQWLTRPMYCGPPIGLSSRVVSASDCGVREPRFECSNHAADSCVDCDSCCDIQYSLKHGLCTFIAVLRLTQPSTLRGTVK